MLISREGGRRKRSPFRGFEKVEKGG